MKPEQERVRHLLTDTVTLLCKNGLQFQDELKVEGVIGITLDNSEVFLVHINEAFGSGGSAKLAPKALGTGSVGATTLAELPGLVSSNPRGRPTRGGSGTMRVARGMRGRPFGSSRRGFGNVRRMGMGRGMMAVNRGHSSVKSPPVVVPQPDEVVPISIKPDASDDSPVVVTCPSDMPSIKQEPQDPTNGTMSDTTPQKNSFVSLSLDDMSQSNLPFFDPMNDNIDQALEPPPAKRQMTSEPNLTSPLDSLMNVVSTPSQSSQQSMTSPLSHNTTADWSSPSRPNLVQVKQEHSVPTSPDQPHMLPPSLQPMGGAPNNWPASSPQKSPQGYGAGPSNESVCIHINLPNSLSAL